MDQPARQLGIFPASGALASSTLSHLSPALVPPRNLTLVCRHPSKVPQPYVQGGATVREASYESSPEELQAAFAGVHALFLVSYPSHVHDLRTRLHRRAVDAAARAGVRHIFYSSLAFAGTAASVSSRAVVMQAHLDTERHLAELAASSPTSDSGEDHRRDGSLTFTSIREGLYSESFPIYTAFAIKPGSGSPPPDEILIPHDGSAPGVAWAKRDELGEASARVIARYLAEPEAYPAEWVNGTLLLTGPRVWTLRETVAALSEAITGDRDKVRIRQVSAEEYAEQEQVKARFGSAETAVSWATAWEGIRAGETAVITETLEQLLGRPPEAFDITIKKMFAH
ncbi:uncharacterized protein E0L32_006476 [Thyridium curvatum]|uniref:NAD(P)-binding domain-containing protein n=1 Tax=Thyridium curvatum TaxID=1093900 RepID=A0A507B8S6_9PEZI|nr:uncharacterized protein E0L32_006476 [Thyridium curvatum]TPX13050.1 hypothetical protein E0L32_006476 [Thyridium curvatum]